MHSINTTRWRVPALAWVPISAAVVAEAVSNALRAYGLGEHLDRFTVTAGGYQISVAGAVLVLAAVAVSLAQARAAWLAFAPGAPAWQRIIAGFAAVVLLAVSTLAMASHVLEAQRAKAGDEGGERGRYDRTLAEHRKVTTELDTLADIRSVPAVKAALDAAPVSRDVFVRTKQCTDMTRADSFAACKPISDLRIELGKSLRKGELETDAKRLAALLAVTKRPEAATAVEGAASSVWAWLFGVATVLVATFGAVLFARAEAVAAAPVAIKAVAKAEKPAPLALKMMPAPAVPALPPPTAHPVLVALRDAGRPLTNGELAAAMNVTHGAATKRRAEVAAQLLERRDGRRKLIELR